MGVSNEPVAIESYAAFARQFGDPIDTDHPMGYAVNHFFTNGGGQALIVRALPATAATAIVHLPTVDGVTVSVAAQSAGPGPTASTRALPRRAGSSYKFSRRRTIRTTASTW